MTGAWWRDGPVSDNPKKKEDFFDVESFSDKLMIFLKLNYGKKVFYFALNFLPWEFLSSKKLDFEKTKAT